jgi:serine/threonine protein phosphatase PrpC
MKPTERRHLEVELLSHAGLSGRNNEDRCAVGSYAGPAGKPVLFAVLSDGIGGHPAGEVAAQIAVDQILQRVSRSDGWDPPRIMKAAISGASRAILSQAADRPEQAGMGATCACAWIAGRRLYTAHVGDSRIYLIRNGQIHRLTVDHTWVQEAIEVGIVEPGQAEDSPNRHVLRRRLGSPQAPAVDLRLLAPSDANGRSQRPGQGTKLMQLDIVLVCSDGLTDGVTDEEILVTVTSAPGLEGAARALVELANARGGLDNTTVILIGV